MRSLFVALVLALALALPASASAANAGELDPAFGTGGVFKQSVQLQFDVLVDVELLPGGGFVAAGFTYDGETNTKVLVAQFTPTGALDTSFAGTGVVVLAFGSHSYAINDVLRQPDGKILLIGSDEDGANDYALTIRLTATGELDGTFGSGTGRIIRDWGGADTTATSAVVEPNGDILSAGWDSSNLAFNRVQEDGTPSFTFVGASPNYVQPLGPYSNGAAAIVRLADGRFATAGYLYDGTIRHVVVTRHLYNGSPDTSFSGDGVEVSDLDPQDAISSAMLLLPDNRMIVAGEMGNGETQDFFVARYLAGGGLDPTFGSGGVTRIVRTGSDQLHGLAQAPNGDLLLSGATGAAIGSYNGDFQVVRLSADGVLDPTFGIGGVSRVDLGANDLGYGVAVQPDGKPIVVGSTATGIQTDDMAAVRLLAVSDPLPALIPVSRITSPSRAAMKRKRFKRFAGTAAPAGQVAKVEIAVRRVNRKQLKKKRCLWLSSNRARFTKIRSTRKRKCSRFKWLRAKGTDNWSYRLKKTLPVGRYEVYARATLKDGQTQTTFTATAGNFRKLTLR